MKKSILFIFTSLFISLSAIGQTPVNFNCNDCAGNNHDLFTELASGKVIVISWVMPCSTCLPPTLTASNIVQSYATSNPGQVLMYVADDYANTTCSSLNSWVNSNGISATTFSNAAVDMLDYGAAGMPKIIVLGGGNTPTVFFNQNGSAAGNASALQAAIDAALATGVDDVTDPVSAISLAPNPNNDLSTLALEMNSTSEMNIEIYNQLGQKVMLVFNGTMVAGKNNIQFSVADLANGIYFVQINNGENKQILKMVVSH